MNQFARMSHFPNPDRDYGAIIFDCDGTLTDSMPVHFKAWNRTMTRYGIDFPEARFYELAGMPTDRIIRLLAEEQGIAIDSRVASREKESAFLDLLHLLRPMDLVIEVAAHYRGRLPMAVASGGFREIILLQLDAVGLAGWFDPIVTAEDTARHKPFPDVFLEAARRMQIPPTECLVYEDADLGLEAAKAAGMDAIDVRQIIHLRS